MLEESDFLHDKNNPKDAVVKITKDCDNVDIQRSKAQQQQCVMKGQDVANT